MHLRPEPMPVTLADLDAEWKRHDRTWTSDACVPEVRFDEYNAHSPTLSLGDHKITLDDEAIDMLCGFYSIPTAYFKRITAEEKNFALSKRIEHTQGEISITYNATGVTDVRRPSQPRLEPAEFIRIAHRIYPASSIVRDHWLTPEDLCLDVLRGTPLADGLHGGLRIAQHRKQNLAPTVSPILYHEPTTTTIQIPDPSLRIDARGITTEKLVERLAAEALRADARLANDAQHLLNLQTTAIGGDRITRLNRVATEHNLPVRPLADITADLSRADEPTLFDLVLTIANTANAPKLTDRNKYAVRTRLQAIAGAIVTDEAQRCSACHALVAA